MVALLDTLSGQPDADIEGAYEALDAALEHHAVDELPEPWPALIAEALTLYVAHGRATLHT